MQPERTSPPSCTNDFTCPIQQRRIHNGSSQTPNDRNSPFQIGRQFQSIHLRGTKLNIRIYELRKDYCITLGQTEQTRKQKTAQQERTQLARRSSVSQQQGKVVLDAQVEIKTQISRQNALKLFINGKQIPTISITTQIIDPLSAQYFKKAPHFLFYEGCPLQDCSICLETYHKGMKLTSLFCNHAFHTSCIEKWLLLKKDCPLCKQDFRNHPEYKQKSIKPFGQDNKRRFSNQGYSAQSNMIKISELTRQLEILKENLARCVSRQFRH